MDTVLARNSNFCSGMVHLLTSPILDTQSKLPFGICHDSCRHSRRYVVWYSNFVGSLDGLHKQGISKNPLKKSQECQIGRPGRPFQFIIIQMSCSAKCSFKTTLDAFEACAGAKRPPNPNHLAVKKKTCKMFTYQSEFTAFDVFFKD